MVQAGLRARDRGQQSSPWLVLVSALEQVPPGGSPVEALPLVLADLHAATGSQWVSAWASDRGQLVLVARWPAAAEGIAEPDVLPGPAALSGLPGVAACVPLTDGDVERGALALHADTVPDHARRRLRDTAACAALLLRGPQLAAALQGRIAVAGALAAELAASRERLSSAEELQRRRTLAEIVAVSAGPFREMAVMLRELAGGVELRGAPSEHVLDAFRSVLDGLIEHFRGIVRGIYPNVLRDRGPRAALEELATDIACPVRFDGTLGERAPWEVESSLYWAAAAALRAMGTAGNTQVEIELRRTQGRIQIRLRQPTVMAWEAVREALDVADDRLAAFGGGLGLTSDEDVTVRVWVPDALLPSVADLGAPRRG